MKRIAKRFNKPQYQTFFDETELKANLGKGNFIFVGSSNDMFASEIPAEWIAKTLDHCYSFGNKYLFQSKNPERILDFKGHPVFQRSVVCTTIESNRGYEFMRDAPHPLERSLAMSAIENIKRYVTIEPILDFDLKDMVMAVRRCSPVQVNIGADTGYNRLPEPPKEKIIALISELEKFTKIKKNQT
jgi:hypothetical protein